MDLRTTWSISNATPENMLVAAAVIQMARRYDLPSELSIFSFPGCQMEQYLFYTGAAVQWAMMSGLTGFASAGNFDGANVWCPEAVVLADETLRYCKRMAAGFEVDEGALGVDAVQRVGHRGEFLSDPHTLIHLRKEKPFESRLLDWSSYEYWRQAGFQTLTDRAHARVEEIGAHHVVPELQPETRRELDQIAKAADRELL
jgi:trimethylamine--corrinoid protein Co-methyltransferase